MSTHALFPDLHDPPPGRADGPFARVAIEASLDRVLDYSIPAGLRHSLRVGQRVSVPLGRKSRPAHGYVVAIQPTTDLSAAKIKPVLAIDDERVLVTPRLMDLALWMSRYYCTPLGTVLESIIPSAVKKKIGLEYSPIVRLLQPREHVQTILERTKARKRRAILARLLQLAEGQAIELIKLAGEAGATPATVRKLVGMGLISVTPEPDLGLLTAADNGGPVRPADAADAVAPALNEDQQKASDDLCPRLANGFSVNLLYGVTGSGKTELYLRCIAHVVAQGRQAIVLVPEIALTPQTVRRFTARFARVAILHSGLAGSQRHRFWQQIATGQADVVVGARSAIFAPLPNLGIIVVDEEHEASYKQDTAPRYHARDVAIKRAQLENIPILLGSATPSLEMWHRVNRTGAGGKPAPNNPPTDEGGPDTRPHRALAYHLLTLPRRVRNLAMPPVELIDMKQEYRVGRRPGVHLLSKRLEHLLGATVSAGHQAILLLNRRGYANFVYCPSCTHLTTCKYCDVTLTYHRSAGMKTTSGSFEKGLHTGQLHCHYCLAVNPLPAACPECGKKLSLFGLGTQRVEEELTRKFPDLRFARVDSDTMHSARDYESLLSRFAKGEVQVMIGTQMIAKGLDYPNVTLVGVISGDTALSLPDFRAAERTFQLITQVAGRAGRGDSAGRVVLQTFLPDDPAIQSAIRQDFVGFAARELANRREVGLPPTSRMVRIILRDQDLPKLHKRAETLAAALAGAVAAEGDAVRLKGPMPCPITRISGYHRSQILLYSPSAARLQRVLSTLRHEGQLARSDRIAIDVDPVSLL